MRVAGYLLALVGGIALGIILRRRVRRRRKPEVKRRLERRWHDAAKRKVIALPQ